jgi:hypothetical protein
VQGRTSQPRDDVRAFNDVGKASAALVRVDIENLKCEGARVNSAWGSPATHMGVAETVKVHVNAVVNRSASVFCAKAGETAPVATSAAIGTSLHKAAIIRCRPATVAADRSRRGSGAISMRPAPS